MFAYKLSRCGYESSCIHKEKLSKTILATANFNDDKEIKKEYDILNGNKDYIAINVNKCMENQLNDNDSFIIGTRPWINKVKTDCIRNARKSLNDEKYD